MEGKSDQKFCNRCLALKPASEFSWRNNADHSKGLQSNCKRCNSLVRAQYDKKPEVQEAFYARHGGRRAYNNARYHARVQADKAKRRERQRVGG